VGVIRIAAGVLHPPPQRVGRIDELELVHHFREAVHLHWIDAERFSHFARRAAPAIRDDVRRHRRPELAILLIDVLNHLLAPVTARQIEIDVGPFATLLRQKPLEQQIHAYRIDRGDPQAVADGAIGRRPPPLHEDVVLAAEIHHVPHDEKVPPRDSAAR
jgi:hypothetical protein